MGSLPAMFTSSLARMPRRVFTPPFLSRGFALRRNGGKRPTRTRSAGPPSAVPPPATPATVQEAWQPVRDGASGGTYYWNTMTNEVTHVGAANPALTPQGQEQGGIMQSQQAGSGGMMSGLGGVVAQGMAFGVGSSIAHHAVGAVMGGVGGGGGAQEAAPPADTGGDFDSDFDL